MDNNIISHEMNKIKDEQEKESKKDFLKELSKQLRDAGMKVNWDKSTDTYKI